MREISNRLSTLPKADLNLGVPNRYLGGYGFNSHLGTQYFSLSLTHVQLSLLLELYDTRSNY